MCVTERNKNQNVEIKRVGIVGQYHFEYLMVTQCSMLICCDKKDDKNIKLIEGSNPLHRKLIMYSILREANLVDGYFCCHSNYPQDHSIYNIYLQNKIQVNFFFKFKSMYIIDEV